MIDVMMIVYSVFVFIITTCIGSFLNVVIYRLPNKMSLAFPASHCPTCNHKLKWYDNIPIFAWLFLKGKCRYCGCKISPRYIIVELLTGISCTLIFLKFGVTFNALYGIILMLCLIPISFIDIEHLIIPDVFIIILLVLGITGLFFNKLEYGSGFISVGMRSKIYAAGGALVFGGLIILLEFILKKDIMGGGDLKLIFVAALLLGWELIIVAIGIASISACIIELARKIKNSKKEEPTVSETGEIIVEQNDFKPSNLFPFGPYLAIGIIISYVFGVNIIEWWLQIIV